MNYLGIDYSVKNMPALDPRFIPSGVWAKAYLKEADRPFKIAVERDHGKITVYETRLRGEAFAAANIRFAERLVKMLLWSVSGFRNAMPGIHHRKPGPIGAGSERENVVAELICDGQHFTRARCAWRSSCFRGAFA